MGTRGRPRTRRVLNVMFDTNAIMNTEFDTFASKAAKNLIVEHSRHGDLDIRWLVPEVVRGEREYQMQAVYSGISRHVAKAESLFAQQWGVTQDRVHQRIAARIDEELAAHGMQVMSCNVTRVDWPDMVRRSCMREPPFSTGKTEKGFRDAVLCETFIQLVGDLTGRDAAVLVSGDQLVKEYIANRGVLGNRARLVDNLESLHDDIQLRVANVDEPLRALIEERAQQIFYPWDPENFTCVWAREQLYDRIWAEHGERLRQAPTGVRYKRKDQQLSNARLVSKAGTRVHLESTYSVQGAYEMWVPVPIAPPDTSVPLARLAGIGEPPNQPAQNHIAQGGLLGLFQAEAGGEWREVNKASMDSISIRWSATLTRVRTLTHARIDELTFVEPAGAQ